MLQRKISLAIAVIMVTAVFAAYGAGNKAPSSTPAQAGNDKVVEFTWFRNQSNTTSLPYWNDAFWIQELERRLNVKIKFEGPLVSPTSAEYTQAVNILLNSGDLPDALYYLWINYSGGVLGGINDKIILPVSRVPEYWDLMPNFRAIMKGNEYIRRAFTQDDGTVAHFNHLENNTNRSCYMGYALRYDWLQKVKLDVPTTVDQLYVVLKAFRDEYKIAPMTDWSGLETMAELMCAWGMKRNIPYPDPDTGKITYWTLYKDGAAFRDFVTTMNKWYKEGLIDPDFATNEYAMRTTKMSSGKAAFSHILPQQYAEWRDVLIKNDPSLAGKARFEGLRHLIGPAGQPYSTNGMKSWASSNNGTVVTTAGDKRGKTKAILKVIDYLYSNDGMILNSWGKEGLTFTVDAAGKRQWTDLVLKNPKYTFNDAVRLYCIPIWGDWPKIMDYDAWLSMETKDPDSRKAHEKYITANPGLSMPQIQLSATESVEYNKIRLDANTMIDEYFINLVTGVRPLSDIDVLLRELKRMGLPRAMEIFQGAYNRYLAK
ncbi:MAG: hypothetical protein FWC45_05650 [Treponema sp.]|nr:hypothetical protein [Treponema sp.]